MLPSRDARHVSIIGAGMAGCFLARLLARNGFRVDVYEAREDPATLPNVTERSINQGLGAHGISALKNAGLWEQVRDIALEDRGKLFHRVDGRAVFQPHGNGASEWLVNRNELN